MRAEGKRRKYEIDLSFYEKLLKTAYGEIEGQTKAVLEVLEKQSADGDNRALIWFDLQNYIEARERYKVDNELIRLMEDEYRKGIKLFDAIVEKRIRLLNEYGLWDEEKNKRPVWDKLGEKLLIDKRLLEKTEKDIKRSRKNLYDHLGVLGGEHWRSEVLGAVERLVELMERYVANKEMLDFIQIEEEIGRALIDSVMIKRLRVVMEYGVDEGNREGEKDE